MPHGTSVRGVSTWCQRIMVGFHSIANNRVNLYHLHNVRSPCPSACQQRIHLFQTHLRWLGYRFVPGLSQSAECPATGARGLKYEPPARPG